ncbi:MAG TPA: lipid A export permease/ATP-binding protein MsbA [Candidatus Thioglobus sp.]|jgi:subfamily B ATP-binding cassette protein MsbA|nr:lipid A export permease/ATP-binding protein MsbA [Candidatus Thioglobus sp.]
MKKKKQQQPVKTTVKPYRRLMGYVFPFWKIFLVSVVGYALYAVTQPLFAMVIKHIIDILGTEERKGMEFLPLFFVALFFMRGVGTFLGSYFLARISAGITHTLRSEIFNHYTCLPISYFDDSNSGYMISRITHNVGEVTRATSDSIRTFVREGFTVIGLLSYLAYVNWQLSMVFLLVAPIIAVLVGYVSKRMKRLSRKMQETVGDMTHVTSEMVNGVRIVKSFGGELYERDRFLKRSLANRGQFLKMVMTMSVHNPLVQFIISLALAGLMYLALFMMENAGPGEFVAYLTAAFLLPRPIRQLSEANGEIQRGIAAAETLFEILDEPLEKDVGHYEKARVDGVIEFKNLSFTYGKEKTRALKNIHLKIKAGQTVALVGMSGGGKSTMINLIPRFYEYQQGEIQLDGIPLKEYKLTNLREQVALVTQHVTLFNDTIANNIAYGCADKVTREQIVQAAKDAYAMNFIENMPKGLDTEIGENGLKLSGGQRQRLALARAFLKNAPILILDEATSALDSESERYIQLALDKVMVGRTTLVVAHRLSTIQNADKIVVLEKGRIIEQGSHKELLQKGKAYQRLYNLQFNDGNPRQAEGSLS